MDLIKKHYEKLLLGVVLLGLAIAAALLPFKIASEKEGLVEQRNILVAVNHKPLTNLNLTRYEAALVRLQKPLALTFSGLHNLINPVSWQKASDGRLIKIQTGKEIGPYAVVVTQINPLYLTFRFNSVSGAGYLVGVENEAALTASKRQRTERLATLNNKSEFFTLREVRGPAASPTALVLELNDSDELVTIGPDKTFKRVEGYEADLKYDPERKTWPGRRVDSILPMAGDEYKVVAITATDVVLSAKSTGKKTTIKFNPSTSKP